MSEFRIISPEKENIILVNDIPDELKKYRLAGAESVMAKGNFGHMLFHHFKGNGFDIWYSNYLIRKTAMFIGSANDPILELHIPFVNDFKAWWDGLEHGNLVNHQFEISYVPFVNTKAEFIGGMNYHTFDIHLSKEILQPYVLHCRKLSSLMDKVEKGKPANMLDMIQFISLDMIRVIRAMLDYKFHEGLAANYFGGLVHELLTLLTIQVSGITDKPKFSTIDLNKAQEARKIIVSDYEVYDTVEKLAKKVGTTELKLQLAFKHLYGTTVAKFSREARMEEGYRLLQTTNSPLRVICEMVGYPDPGNFSVRFKNHYGYWPGEIQKRAKR